MKPYLTKVILTSLTMTSSLFAQASSEDIPVPETQGESDTIASNAVELAKEAVKPLANQGVSKIDDARNKEYHLRSLELFKMRATYLDKLSKGEVIHNGFLLEKVPAFKEDLPALTSFYNDALTAEDPETIKKHTHNILSLLQPFGLILAGADHEQNSATLSTDQVAEAAQWQTDFHKAMSTKDKDLAPLIFLPGQAKYTLLHLETPILLRGKPNSTIYLETQDGGSFANGVNRIQITADDKGFATTHWISRGESVGQGMITIYSAGSPELIYHVMEVKQLKLKNLDVLTQAEEFIPKSIPNKAIPNLIK